MVEEQKEEHLFVLRNWEPNVHKDEDQDARGSVVCLDRCHNRLNGKGDIRGGA